LAKHGSRLFRRCLERRGGFGLLDTAHAVQDRPSTGLPECKSLLWRSVVRPSWTGTPTAADANSEFDKAIAGIKLLGATPGTEPSSTQEVEPFCHNGHKLRLEEIGRQMVEQCAEIKARSGRLAQSPAPPTRLLSDDRV
jgi:hypothetical protein